jgi:hypothetical protein
MSETHSNGTAPHLKTLETSATAVFMSRAIVTRMVAGHGTYDYDIDGTLEAGQYGATFVAARSALHNALLIYLAQRGHLPGLPSDFREIGPLVFELLAAAEPDGEVLAEAWALECTNPMSVDDLRTYVERYRDLFERLLQLHLLPTYRSLHDDTGFSRYLELQEQLASAFEHLGMTGVNLSEARRRMERRALVNARLGGVVDETPAAEGLTVPAPPDAGPEDCHMIPVTLTAADWHLVRALVTERAAALDRQLAAATATDGRNERRALLTEQERCEQLSRTLRSLEPNEAA